MNYNNLYRAVLRVALIFTSLAIFCNAFTLPAKAQVSDWKISVIVKDQNGASVAGAKVVLSGRNLLSRTTVTDAAGSADFANVPDGDLRISVEATGFAAVLRDVISQEKNGTVEIVLSPGTISEDVTVTAARTQVTASETAVPVSVLNREEIERKAVNTISDVCRTLPGTSTRNEGAFQGRPRNRGVDSNL
ncbi:MAG: carboxypeptidase regulatory-like domain-containing protein, partial [Blastocatellia bacterium]